MDGTKNEKQGQSCANPLDVAWLAGILDGEGSFVSQFVKDKQKRMVGVHLAIRVSNTNRPMMDRVQHIVYQITDKKNKILKHSEVKGVLCSTIQVCDQRSCRKLCEAVIPHLTAKRKQAQALLDYVNSRLGNRHHGRGYSNFELEIVPRLRALKKDGVVIVGGASTKRTAPSPEG